MTGYFPFQGNTTETDKLNQLISQHTPMATDDLKALERAVLRFLKSDERKWMLLGEAYYEGEHDILKRERTVIGPNGMQVQAEHLPNNRRVDNQYAMLVDQKVNYLLAKPLTVETQNEQYHAALKQVLNKRFHRLLRNVGEASLNQGLAWLHPYYDEKGQLAFKRFPAHEILPFWEDGDKTSVKSAMRIYNIVEPQGTKEKIVTKVEHYQLDGIDHYEWVNNALIPAEARSYYLTLESYAGEELQVDYLNWERLPLIPFKYNHKVIPLIKRVKNLQDAYNKILSNFENHMDEDTHNTIIVLENYDGQNLGEFRHNLAKFGAVKVRSDEGSRGDVRTLEITVNKDNYESILKLFKRAIIENGKGVDMKDERMGGNMNQMNIQSMYLDIDLDANAIETEYQAAFEDLLWFVNQDFANKGLGDFEGEQVDIIFNRDVLINETEVIEGLDKSTYLSEETRIAQHPYVKDVQLELKRKKQEEQAALNMHDNYDDTFKQKQQGKDGDEDGE
ncbi:phage portal protein [Lysinibacillus sp. KU-BSD001]|uniref:phage portal protein n=1 Tax=Lysinibacillus sp. KU-BSD001 TaxID=3141328 RepID=UPI0036ECF225